MSFKMIDFNVNNSILIVIDIINSCASPECEIKKWGISFKKIRRMIPKLSKFIKDYKKISRKPVIYVNCVKWDKKHLTDNINELYKIPRSRYYSEDETVFPEEFYGVKPDKKDVIITKNHYDVFTSPELNRYLKKKKIKYLIVTGIFGDGCVDASIKGGFSKGYNFIILKDLYWRIIK